MDPRVGRFEISYVTKIDGGSSETVALELEACENLFDVPVEYLVDDK